MEIREINLDQIEQIKQRMLDIFSGEPWNDRWTQEQLHCYIAELTGNTNSLSFGLYREDALIGIALGRVKSWYEGREYWIEEFGILPELQQKGFGSAFLNGIEEILAKKGIPYVALLTQRNFPAYHFYVKNGFEEQKETVFFVKKIGREGNPRN